MKKLISSLMIALFILLSCVVSNAAGMANLSIVCESNSVDAGSEITIYLKLDSISGIESLTALEAVLEYNKTVFELVNMTSAEGSDWGITSPTQTGKFSAIYRTVTGAKSGNIAKIVLRAIGSPANGEAIVTIKNIVVTDGNTEERHEDISYNMTVRDPETSPAVPVPPKDPVEPTNPDTPTGPSGTTDSKEEEVPVKPVKPNNTTTTNTQKTPNESVGQTIQNINNNGGDVTTAKSKIPAAGIDITSVILILLAIVLGTATFIRYKKSK